MSKKSKLLLEESKKRRSYRKFIQEEIDIETIKDCILTAGSAPSGADKQPWFYTVVVNQEVKDALRFKAEAIEKDFYENKISKEWKQDLEKLSVNTSKPFLSEAPCLIIIFKKMYQLLDNNKKDMNYYPNESVGISIGLLINALRNAGYSSLTYTPAPMNFLLEMFHRPEGELPVMILAVGKPDETYQLPTLEKKTLDEISEFIV